MICKFEIYKSCYVNSKTKYVSFNINFKMLKRHQRNLRLNALMRDEECSCNVCKPYTGN